MTLVIKKQLVTSRQYTYSGTNGRRFITIHETANLSRGANAQAHANLQTRGFSSSFHWQVDDTQAIQSYPHSVQCWHAGTGRADGNLNSIAIEICVNSDGDFKKAVANAAKLVRKIMKDEGISIGNVVQHNRWSGKNCPTNLRNGSKGITWNQFIASIRGGNTVTVTPNNPAKSPTKSPTKVTPKKSVVKSSTVSKSKWTKVSGNWTGQTLRNGQYGVPVTQLQSKLASVNFYPNKGAKNNGVDSYYGDDTMDAVRRYQSVNGLTADGIAGVKTYVKLNGTKTKVPAKPKAKSSVLPNAVYRANKPYPKGVGVRQVQTALASVHFYPNKGAKNNGIDSVYGPDTADAVRRFQSVNGLKADGVYGPATRAKLIK